MNGLPYMGGKRKLAHKIVGYIMNYNPKIKYVYDLFGGGGAISFEFLKRKRVQVHYNELNPSIAALMVKLQREGVTKDMYEWVSRETFFQHVHDKDWFGGYLQTCWSFGNGQRSYLFGKHIENDKRLIHEFLVKGDIDSDFPIPLTQEDIHYILSLNGVHKRRLKLYECAGKLQRRLDLQQLERLEQLERLQQLERLPQLHRLGITNLDYRAVEINTPVEETIIYCDPPYKNTKAYKEGGFNHNEFYDWIKASRYKIYVSEYALPQDFTCVYEMEHRSSLSATNNSKKTVERLFCNKAEGNTKKGWICKFKSNCKNRTIYWWYYGCDKKNK